MGIVQPAEQNNFALLNLNSTTDKINKTLGKIKEDFVYIGFLLWEVREYKFYESKGYSSVVEYAEKELNFKKTSTYNFISVCEKFSSKKENGNPTMNLDSKFKDFSFSQLVEIKTLPVEQLNSFNPNMSKRDIREKKKELNNVSVESIKNNIVEVDFVEDHEELQKDIREVQIVNFATGKVYSNPTICDEHLSAAQDKKIFNNKECEKVLELLTDRYKLIENFIDNGVDVAPINDLQAELKLLESIMSKL